MKVRVSNYWQDFIFDWTIPLRINHTPCFYLLFTYLITNPMEITEKTNGKYAFWIGPFLIIVFVL